MDRGIHEIHPSLISLSATNTRTGHHPFDHSTFYISTTLHKLSYRRKKLRSDNSNNSPIFPFYSISQKYRSQSLNLTNPISALSQTTPATLQDDVLALIPFTSRSVHLTAL